MKAVNAKTGRAVGGFSYTDSIVRTNADVEHYVDYIVTRVNNELLTGDEKLRYVRNSKYIQFFLGDKKLLWLKPEQIEQYRSYEVTMLERILISNVECMGLTFDKENKYYKQVWKME